ncbi:hypothetical protein ACHQM5_007900 [Ranunculus cassubicifolius]
MFRKLVPINEFDGDDMHQTCKQSYTLYSFVRFFQDCPVLEELKIQFWKSEMNGYLLDVDIKLMLELDEYFFNHLKVVNILNFSYSLKNMLLLKLLWKGAPILQKVNLHLDEWAKMKKS